MKNTHWLTLLSLIVVAPSALLADRTVSSDFTQDGGTFVISPAGNLFVSHATNNPLLTMTDAANTSGITNVFVGTLNGEEGQVLVEQGSILTNSGFSNLALNKGSTGTVTVTGTNSQWQTSKPINVGYSGNGTLNVENGGLVNSGDGNLGSNANSIGTATITGQGSQWNSGVIALGVLGTGTLNVEDGGIVHTNSLVNVGNATGSSGAATITGTGSKWQIDTSLNIGSAGGGTGTLSVENGGLVTSNSSTLGLSSDGVVTITGSGSKWQIGNLLDIADAGRLNVNDGGVVELGGFVSSFGTISGNGGTIVSNVYNSGLISPGNSPGVLTIDGDLASDGVLKFELAGTGSGLFDQLFVSGNVRLAGVVEVDLLDGFAPTIHSQFKVFDFNSLEDFGYTFDFTHAALGSGLSWDTSTFSVDGTVRVVPEASSLVLAGVGMLVGLICWRTKSRSQ